MLDNKKIAAIHLIKKKLNLSDEEYRRILKESAGVLSSKDLDEKGFLKLMKYFAKTEYYRETENSITIKQKLFIDSLYKKLKWDSEHFKNYLHKYYHKEEIERFDKREASKLIVALNKIYESKK